MLEFIESCKDIYDNKLKEVCCAMFYIINAYRHKPDEVTLNGLKYIYIYIYLTRLVSAIFIGTILD